LKLPQFIHEPPRHVRPQNPHRDKRTRTGRKAGIMKYSAN
jgi:hypothetical protein